MLIEKKYWKIFTFTAYELNRKITHASRSLRLYESIKYDKRSKQLVTNNNIAGWHNTCYTYNVGGTKSVYRAKGKDTVECYGFTIDGKDIYVLKEAFNYNHNNDRLKEIVALDETVVKYNECDDIGKTGIYSNEMLNKVIELIQNKVTIQYEEDAIIIKSMFQARCITKNSFYIIFEDENSNQQSRQINTKLELFEFLEQLISILAITNAKLSKVLNNAMESLYIAL